MSLDLADGAGNEGRSVDIVDDDMDEGDCEGDGERDDAVIEYGDGSRGQQL